MFDKEIFHRQNQTFFFFLIRLYFGNEIFHLLNQNFFFRAILGCELFHHQMLLFHRMQTISDKKFVAKDLLFLV